MEDFIIDVKKIEELQTIQDIPALDLLFEKAKRQVVGGGSVVLVRSQAKGKAERFDEFTNEADLEAYRKNVYKYLQG